MIARILLAFTFVSFLGALACDGTAGDVSEQDQLEPGVESIELTSEELRTKPPKVCKGKAPRNFGQPCNCFGTIGCDGTCNVEKSAAQSLCEDTCGATYSCATGCSQDISNYGELCCNGLGTVTCGGGCSFVCF